MSGYRLWLKCHINMIVTLLPSHTGGDSSMSHNVPQSNHKNPTTVLKRALA